MRLRDFKTEEFCLVATGKSGASLTKHFASQTAATRFRALLCIAGASLVASLCVFTSHALRGNGSRVPRGLGDLRGEPINAALSNNPGSTLASSGTPSDATSPPIASISKRHPKPASFQHRMVEFQVQQAEGTNSQQDAGLGGGSPAKVIYSPAQLAALSGPALPTGCEDLDFATLSGFPFDVTSQMAEGSNNLVAASATTRAKIPRTVQNLDNQFVAIRGFLLPLKMNNGLTIEFLLMRNQNMCCFGSVPKINEWICVDPVGEGVKPVMDQPITIMGKLRVGELRENGYLVGIYRMDGAQVFMSEENQRMNK